MKLKQTSTDQPAASPSFGGYWRNADYVTSLRSRAYIEASAGVAALVLGGWASLEIASALPMIPAIYVASVMGLRAVVRWRRTDDVMRELWRQETATGRDLDGDGAVGKPPKKEAGHIVTVPGKAGKREEIVLPDLDPEPDTTPLIGFPVCANDVLFLLNSMTNGQQVTYPRQALTLPSGVKISTGEEGQRFWRAFQDGLIRWQFASERQTQTGKRQVWLHANVSIQEMMRCVRDGAGMEDERV